MGAIKKKNTRHDPKSTVGIIFPIKVFAEVEYDCDDIDVGEITIGGWNRWPAVVTSYYKITVNVNSAKKVPCQLSDCKNAIKWKFKLKYTIYLIADVGLFDFDEDVDTYPPVVEYADFETDCICCDNN